MRNNVERIIRLKQADIYIQLIAFIIMIPCWFFMGPFALYVTGLVQALSCIFWSQSNNDFTRPQARTIIQRIFFVTLGALVLALLIAFVDGGGSFFWLSMFLLLAGPILGIAYFIITCREVTFYKRLL